MKNYFKEVLFNIYCPKCEHKDVPDHENPCDECLYNTYNIHSHKPVNYKEKEK